MLPRFQREEEVGLDVGRTHPIAVNAPACCHRADLQPVLIHVVEHIDQCLLRPGLPDRMFTFLPRDREVRLVWTATRGSTSRGLWILCKQRDADSSNTS